LTNSDFEIQRWGYLDRFEKEKSIFNYPPLGKNTPKIGSNLLRALLKLSLLSPNYLTRYRNKITLGS
jgi:hypothetical protein